MSLLMQALKKAERARQSGLQEEDLRDAPYMEHGTADTPAGSGAGIDSPGMGNAAIDGPAPAFGGGLELSLEPLDAPARAEPAPPLPSSPPPPPPIQPAVEATHNPVPPQARHEGARARTDSAEIPVADARAAASPAGAMPDNRRGSAQPERRAVPRSTAGRNDNTSGIDMGQLRLAGLAAILVIVAGTFGYVYWQAVSGPGPGASLPMVPMPPPSATGATNATADGGIPVAPAVPPFGPLGTPAPGTDANGNSNGNGAGYGGGSAAAPATTQALPDAVPPAATPVPADPLPAASRGRRAGSTAGPTAAQLAAIADPEARREAQRDADERADREARMQAQSLYAGAPDNVPPPGASAPAYAPAGTPAADVQVARGASAPAINPAVQAGYAAFGAGDLATARLQYAAALRQDPNNRDALLGSAVIAARERRDDDAAGFYARLLAANPRDVEAIAGLAGLRPGDGDRAEIRLKGVLRNNQDAPSVHFALGNLYARQGRWQEAQQAYFRAWSAAPDNADYAFNLAVGLDRLNQGRLARDYYGRALALAAGGAAAFDRMAVQRRMQELAPAGAAAAAPLTVPAPVPADAQVPAARVGN